MKRTSLRYGIWLLGWFCICPATWANSNKALSRSDTIQKGTVPFSPTTASRRCPENRDSPQRENRDSPQDISALEQRLFADAADGRLDIFSLLDAALIASGVDDATTLQRYRERFAVWAAELGQSISLDESPRRRVEVIFHFLHGKILHGKYNIECTDLRRTMDEGGFNCVSATVLFNCLADGLGLSCCALETPGHALSRVYLPDGTIDVETTCPRWFQLQHDPEKQAKLLEKTLGSKVFSDKTKLREISPIQLTAMVYYNRGVDFLAEKRFADAALANAKALRLDPLNGTARGNFLATINNWAIELGNTNHFAEAVVLLRRGLVYDPHYEAFTLNFEHVHHQWSQQLCKEGRYREAADLLSKAASEMPDRKYFGGALWDIYRHWALALFEADKIDSAFEVFAEARRCHGSCQEEMECELAVVVEYGKKLMSQSRYEDAKQLFDRALILQPASPILQDSRQGVAVDKP